MNAKTKSYEDDLPDIQSILEYWRSDNRLWREAEFLIDWGEPSCWACDKFWNGRYDIRRPNASWADCVKAWEKAPLPRCHIIPRSLGGCSDASNLFLMCHECHDLAPDTVLRHMFFTWIKNQHWWRRETAHLRQAFESFCLDANDEQELSRILTIMQNEDFKEWAVGKAGIHRFQQLRRGAGVSLASYLALVLEYEQRQKTG